MEHIFPFIDVAGSAVDRSSRYWKNLSRLKGSHQTGSGGTCFTRQFVRLDVMCFECQDCFCGNHMALDASYASSFCFDESFLRQEIKNRRFEETLRCSFSESYRLN